MALRSGRGAAGEGRRSEAAEVEIRGIAAGGAGVGVLPDGRAVFVHRTAPGERVALALTESKRRFARGRLLRVLRPAADRRRAPCPHYDRCGGCTLEHLRYEAQLRAKADMVADALRRIGGLEAPAPEIVPSPQEFRYRNRLSLTLRRLGGGRVVAGFHELEQPGRIMDVTPACLLPEPALAAAWGELRAGWGENAHRLPSGDRLRLTLRVNGDGAASLTVEGGYSAGEPEALLEGVPALRSVWHRPRDADAARLLAGEPSLPERWAGLELELRGDVFLQVNRGAAAALEEHVLELAGDVAGRDVVDAYCGVGAYASRLAAAGARAVGIELDPRAVDAGRAAGAAAAAGVRFLVGRVEERLPSALPAELVILNPPRAGLDAAVPGVLLDAPPSRVVYVSCDPATLARDLARLRPAYRLRSLRCFDMFPQTSHVETVAELLREMR